MTNFLFPAGVVMFILLIATISLAFLFIPTHVWKDEKKMKELIFIYSVWFVLSGVLIPLILYGFPPQILSCINARKCLFYTQAVTIVIVIYALSILLLGYKIFEILKIPQKKTSSD